MQMTPQRDDRWREFADRGFEKLLPSRGHVEALRNRTAGRPRCGPRRRGRSRGVLARGRQRARPMLPEIFPRDAGERAPYFWKMLKSSIAPCSRVADSTVLLSVPLLPWVIDELG